MLEQVKDGGVSVNDAVEKLRHLPFEDLGFAHVDLAMMIHVSRITTISTEPLPRRGPLGLPERLPSDASGKLDEEAPPIDGTGARYSNLRGSAGR